MTGPTPASSPLRLVTRPEPVAPSDDYLMGLAASGDQASFVELVRRHEASVRTFCECLVGNAPTAQDLAQDAFLDVWKARGRYRSQGRFRELLFTVARNRCRSLLRRKWLRRLLSWDSLPEDLHPTSATLEEHRVELEREALVRRALSGLPEKFRTPLTLRFVEGLDYAAIAHVIGRTESAARSRVHYGLKAFAQALPPELADDLP